MSIVDYIPLVDIHQVHILETFGSRVLTSGTGGQSHSCICNCAEAGHWHLFPARLPGESVKVIRAVAGS